MKSNLLRGIILFSILATSIIIVACGNEPIATPYVSEEFVVCNTSSGQMLPSISGDIVVWADDRNMTPESSKFNKNTDIYACNLNDSLEFPVCKNAYYQGEPNIDGDIVVWTDGRNDYSDNTNADIYGHSLSSHTEFIICNESHDQAGPSVSGDVVVWRDGRAEDGNYSYIYGYNLSNGAEFPVSIAPSLKMFPSIRDNIVTWLDFRNVNTSAGPLVPPNTEIYAYDLSSATEFAITDDELMQDPPGTDIYGDIMVWSEGHQDESATYICSYSLTTQTKSVLITSRDSIHQPVIYGDVVVWNDYRNGNGDIYGYNIKTGEEFAICTDPGQQQNPAIYENIVVWEDDREEVANTYDIYGARLTFDNP